MPYFAAIFLCFVICVTAVEYEPILFKISNGKSECNSEGLLSGFDLNDVPQFGATCNIPAPDKLRSEFLIENNVIPVLCMGVYDAFLRLCKVSSNDVNAFSDVFPATTDKFTHIFSNLDKKDNYSSLETFCDSTVSSNMIPEASNNITEHWWGLLNRELKSKEKCMIVCRSYEKSKVQPLCSYIMWANAIFHNYKRSQAQAAVEGESQTNTGLENKSDPLKNVLEEPNQAKLSALENKPQNGSIEQAVGADNLPQIAQKPTEQSVVANGGLNTTLKQVVGSMSNNEQSSVIAQGDIVESTAGETKEAVMVFQDKALTSNKTEINTSGNAAITQPNIHEDNVHLPVNQPNNASKVESSAQEAPLDSVNAGAESNNPASPKSTEQSKPKSDKVSDGIVEGDFSFEVTPEGIGLDQPVVADKEPQPPYSDEEVEDGDGDDVDMEPEGPAKTSPTKNGASKATASNVKAHSNDQGAEPDRVYSEVDREILIEDHFIEAEDSHFFTYFLCMAVLTILAYLAFHNKKKLIALAVEGRRTRGTRRRPNCSNYSKLDCSLEEAMVSNTTASVTHVLY